MQLLHINVHLAVKELRKLITLTLEQPTKAAACDNSPALEGFGGARKKISLVVDENPTRGEKIVPDDVSIINHGIEK